MKNNIDIKEIFIVLCLVISVLSFWKWNASRPTDEEGTRAVLEAQAEWQVLAKKYPVKGE